jgi:hypothetical protein
MANHSIELLTLRDPFLAEPELYLEHEEGDTDLPDSLRLGVSDSGTDSNASLTLNVETATKLRNHLTAWISDQKRRGSVGVYCPAHPQTGCQNEGRCVGAVCLDALREGLEI